MKLLNGAELANYIKERQSRQVRALRQASNIIPRLAIIQTIDSPVIERYVALKKQYGQDILVEVDQYRLSETEALTKIEALNQDDAVHGIIVQLPLSDASFTDQLVNCVAPSKDVDGLGAEAQFEPATATAINWLLTGYNIEMKQKKIVIVGLGRLVGAPLLDLWQVAGYDVTALTRSDENIEQQIAQADIVVSATGSPGIITSSMLKIGAVVVDAGTASEGGIIRGDVAPDVYETRHDLSITPVRGGVGPLTVTALFDNVIRSAQALTTTNQS